MHPLGSMTATRRSILAAGTATAAALLATGPAQATSSSNGVQGRLRELERLHGARVGVFARNLATGTTVLHREDERFPICSLFKPLAAAAVLRDLDRKGEFLARRVRYSASDVVADSPVTGEEKNIAEGLTVEQLCAAAICRSDNTAGNLLLRELGGPQAVTRFSRSIGDRVTRLDRWETEVNSAEPWRREDTTTARAIARSYAHLTLGTALEPHDRERLTAWLLANETSGNRFRAGLPKDWTVADKTGAGHYGTNNNAGIAWTPDGAPVVLAVLTTRPGQADLPDSPLIVKVAALLAENVG